MKPCKGELQGFQKEQAAIKPQAIIVIVARFPLDVKKILKGFRYG
jgi:hypothetical protein